MTLQCPLCNRSAWRFAPLRSYYLDAWKRFGSPVPPDRWETLNIRSFSCPHCGAVDRERLIWPTLRERLVETPHVQTRVLDLAPGGPLSAAIRRTQVDYVTADLRAGEVDVRLDITHLPFPDGTFDVLLCSHVLEHVADDRAAMRELTRVLGPRGVGYLLVPIALDCDVIDETNEPVSAAEAWARFAQDDHVRLYNRQGFVDRLTDSGLDVNIVDRRTLGRRAFRRHGLTPSSALYVVQRKDSNEA